MTIGIVQLLDELGGFVADFTIIQDAIDAAGDGYTIVIGEGTYTEQIIVDGIDDLTITTDGGPVTVKAPADVVQTTSSSSGREVHAVVTVLNSDNVMIDSILVDGDGRGNTVSGSNPNFVGVFYRNASGGLTDVDVIGIRDPYEAGFAAGGEPIVSGNQRGVGVQADNDSLMAFSMSGGSISDFQKNATVFNFADLTITGVSITGGGAQTGNAQNGIQLLNSTGTISNNVITGIGYAGPADAYSGAILGLGNTDVDILDNIIIGANNDSLAAKVVGIFILDFFATNSGGSITGNSIAFVDEGIDVSGDLTPNSILIEDNVVTTSILPTRSPPEYPLRRRKRSPLRMISTGPDRPTS
jgi:hypothetical protein